jgi:amino acid adenylation domain-containing protein
MSMVNISNSPDKTAVVFDGEQLTYSELNEKSDLIAKVLCAKGIGRGDIIPILLESGIDTITTMLGVLKSGAAFSCINTDYPQDRIDFICRDTSAKLIIDASFFKELHKMPQTEPKNDISENDLAAVVYTSGSTGNPKGVLLPHRALDMYIDGNGYKCTKDDVFLLVASLSFIGGIAFGLSALAKGQTLHIANQQVRKDAAQIVEYSRNHGITTAFFPPQLAKFILEKEDGLLRVLFTGSEKVSGLFSEKTNLINIYGASETFGPLTSFGVDKGYEYGTPIGKPFTGSKIILLDENENPVSDGQEGEICISGQIALGYLNLPELTARKFIPNPLNKNEMLYKTGDIGRVLEDGNLIYVQRKDWMMKVRGFRVEPGEIETAMRAHESVNQAIVTSFQNAASETALYGVYTASTRVDSSELEKFIRKTLPDYMIPAFMEQHDSLPLNVNGKIDRKNIKAPDAARFTIEYEPPQNDTERILCEAMSKILKVKRVGALDSFSLLGGDSMLAAKLQTELPRLSTADILTLNTPRALAATLTSNDKAAAIKKATPRENYPLTFAERQMATEQYMNPKSNAYNVNMALEITGALDVIRLEQAFSTLVKRYTAFRSYYPMENGDLVHKIAEELTVSLEVIHCASDEVEGLIKKSNAAYNLSAPPLFRFTLYQIEEKTAVLNFNLYHIIYDGTSHSVVIDELWRLYNGEELPPVNLDYTDYAVWQSEQTEDATEEKYFTNMFADGVPENEMPTKPRRPDTLPFADMDCVRTIDITPIAETARKYGVTTFKLLFSAVGLTLAKYCTSEDVTIGTAMSGRSHSQTASMVGMFVNTLPVRIKTPADISAEEYIKAVANTISEIKKHQTYPFEKIVPQLAPERNASRNPVFDVIVNYLNEFHYPENDGLIIRELPIKRQALAMDLMLEFLREGDKLRIVLSYSRELYQDEVVSNMMEQLLEIISRLTTNREQTTLRDLTELPQTQRKQILEDFAGERNDENLGKTLVELFREQAKKTPDNRAVVFGEKIISYAELDGLTDKIAAHIAERSGNVGILVNRSEMMPICAMGVMKSGAAYLPLDPSYPAERLEFMLQDANVSVVIADENLQNKIPNYNGEFLFTKNISHLPHEKISASPKPQDTMVLLYTSGTTGKPKGVMLSHGNLVNFCTWYKNYHGITERDNIPAYASFGFDAHLMDMYPALISGACLHIISEEMRLDLPGLRNYFTQNHISVAFITTQLGRQFAESMSSPGLRSLSVGGETLVPLEPPKGYTLYNFYGPTECTVGITDIPVDKLYDRVPIGRAFNNTSLYVVDKHNRLTPVGVAGEMCVAGRQVGKGYLNRTDITEEKFVKNPFSNDPDYAVMYRTGDVVRFLPDGNIDFVGRSDFQIKIRGFRVELTEIEERIRAFPAVKDAAVVASDASGGGKCAVAYIVGDSPVDIEKLNCFIEEELPSYMVPAATMQIEKIPLNQNGKVDRRKLPTPKFSVGNEENQNETRPLSDLEMQIFQIIAKILGHEQINLTTNLLRAGLTSLSCIKLAAMLDEKFGVSPAVRDIMKNPTLLGIENAVIGLLLSRKSQQTEQKEVQPEYPLSSNQLGVYLDCLKDPGSVRYNIPFMLTLPTNTDTEKLRDTVCKVINAHPAVKVRIGESESGAVQIPDNTSANISLKKLSEAELLKLRESFVRPFDLTKSPLYRAVVAVTPERVVLLCNFHHIAFDGGSLDLFLREIGTVYGGGQPAVEKLSAFEAALDETEQEEDKKYFEEQLKEFEAASEIPPDIGQDGMNGSMGETVRKADRKIVEAFCATHGVTSAALFLAATSYAVGRWTQQSTAYISGVSSGRGDTRLMNTVGMFVRTLPLAVRREKDQTCLEFIRGAQQALTGAVAHEGYPYMNIVRDFGYVPSIMYTCELGVINEYHIGGALARFEILGQQQPKFKLSVHIEERDGDIVFAVQYNDALYSKMMTERFTETLLLALQNLIRDTSAPVCDISLLSENQRALIEKFNLTQGGSSCGVLHRLFESAAKKTPDHIALLACDCSYTYAELNAEANKVANALLKLGVQKEERVAFMLRRTSRVLVAMLGVLKAGCAYIPLDPEYPEERIAHILSDSGAKHLLEDADIDKLLEEQNTNNPNIEVSPDNLAYIIYTSGSTGKPKGVMIEHRGIANYVDPHPLNIHVHAMVEENVRMMSITTVAFDMFLKESMTTLCNGLTLVFACDDAARDPSLLAKLFEETNANAFNTTPSVMMELTEYPTLLSAIQKCKIIMCGAEKYPEVLLKRLRTGARLFNTYGPTEISVSCNGKELTDVSRVTVGKPLLNVTEQIIDTDGNALPCGMTGELIVGGRGVARGYVNLPELTAERFININGERYYKTGDIARWTADGEIEILGRNDSQIKLRGLRIELGEIENALQAIEGVGACAVVIRKLQNADHLCAYYTAAHEIPPEEIKEKLKRTLTGYMIPTAYLQLPVMPKTPGGKTDTRALPAPTLLGQGDYVAPQGETEEKLCAVFAEVLGLERVGATDNFFEIGGTSLAVTRIVIAAENAALYGENGEKISYSNVFLSPTPRELASTLNSGHTSSAAAIGGTKTKGRKYDYSQIHSILAENNINTFRQGGTRKIGNVLLTGATGFLGIHILFGLLKTTNSHICCLVRQGKNIDAEKRLRNLLFYYFEDASDFSGRLRVIEGDMTDNACLANINDINTVINCAANVTHFAKDSNTFNVNIGGVKNLISFCKKNNARLIHISTASIAGLSVGGFPSKEVVMDETMLYFGQNLENQYIHSKFMAERAVLEAALKGLDAKIMRVGNLMARKKDGEFQINAKANSFLGRLRAYHAIGYFPYSSYHMTTELAPIDSTTAAVLRLAETSASCRVFHPYNNHKLFMGDIVLTMKDLGITIDMAEDDVFENALSTAMKDPTRAESLTSLIAYQNMAQGKAAFPVAAKNDYTTQVLLRLGWRWPETDGEYLRKFLSGLMGLGFFGGNENV